ncbi:MAG: hypothetical protein K8R67_19515 [Desulfobacteraceae bacterium]|nr:hypothetical protein [Desulfobacteraceae bacterium]
MKKKYFIIVLVLFSCSVFAGNNKLLETLRSEDDLDLLYNEINHVEWSTENLDVVQAVWNKDIDKYPDLPWQKLDNDIVRLALFNVLMQAHRNCKIESNMNELHDFVRSKTTSKNLKVKGRATYLLGLAGRDEDIPFLSSIVESEENGWAEEAALSLTFIHTNAAVDALRSLQMKVRRQSLKDVLRDMVKKYDQYPLTQQSKGCE